MVFKRPARASSGAAKRAKLDPVERACSLVLEGISESNSVPKVVQRMLGDMVEASLGAPVDERHKFQASVVAMIREVLKGAEAGMQEEVAKVAELFAVAEGATVKNDSAIREADKDVAAQEAKACSAKVALASDAKAVKATAQAITEAEESQAAGEETLQGAQTKRAKLASAMQDCAGPLVEGSAEDSDARGLVIKLVHVLTDFEFDESMTTAIPEALSKKPVERGAFDAMVVQQLSDEVSKRLAAFDGILNEAEQIRSALASALTGAEASQSAAKQARLASAAAFLQAQAAHRESMDTLAAAQQAQSRTKKEMQQHLDFLEDIKERLAAFREGPLAAFAELRDREAPKAPVAEAVAKDAVAEEEAPEAAAAAPEAEAAAA